MCIRILQLKTFIYGSLEIQQLGCITKSLFFSKATMFYPAKENCINSRNTGNFMMFAEYTALWHGL